ncbi:hypothetical protein [Kitasatospora sp. GP82]|uniref:hypothetical protein n=1 Tax=Kitasatospora sp. GP82 TaxID=3035089 RepID=UPI002476387F|nr:hypothetical protein [Kitasatospora sp. GP82]MDH6126454.1 LSD1 subclass zinc finger protein [Kitasatospora sp. GP82]
MRLVFVCQECTVRYLPPIGLRYPDGAAASAVWCSGCQAVMRERGVLEPAALAAVAVILAVRAMKAAVTARASTTPHPDRRPSRPPRTSRGRVRPGSTRSKLA